MTDDEIEKMIQEKGLNAPRITPQDIEDQVMSVAYHRFPGTTVTACCVTTRNGFTTVGYSACASPTNFNEEIGREIALKEAKGKIWPLEGYLLRQRLSEMHKD